MPALVRCPFGRSAHRTGSSSNSTGPGCTWPKRANRLPAIPWGNRGNRMNKRGRTHFPREWRNPGHREVIQNPSLASGFRNAQSQTVALIATLPCRNDGSSTSSCIIIEPGGWSGAAACDCPAGGAESGAAPTPTLHRRTNKKLLRNRPVSTFPALTVVASDRPNCPDLIICVHGLSLTGASHRSRRSPIPENEPKCTAIFTLAASDNSDKFPRDLYGFCRDCRPIRFAVSTSRTG